MLRRPLFLLLLAACRAPNRTTVPPPSQPGSVQPPPAPEPVRDAAIDGTVTDAQTGTGVVGVAIIASRGTSAEPGISDETGHFHIAVASGRYHVVTYYGDSTVDRGDVDVAANATIPLALSLPHAVLTAPPPAWAKPADCPPDPKAPAATTDDRDALVAGVLEHYLADPTSVIEGEQLARSSQIYVASDYNPDWLVSARSLPSRMVLRSLRDLQADADRRRTEVAYLGIFYANVVGSCGMIGINAELKTPRGAKPSSHSKCGTTAMYEKKDGRWAFKEQGYDICP